MTPKDIAEFVSELIDEHTGQINNEAPVGHPDHVPHIVTFGRTADIEIISWTDDGEIILALSDGQGDFDIRITRRG